MALERSQGRTLGHSSTCGTWGGGIGSCLADVGENLGGDSAMESCVIVTEKDVTSREYNREDG